MYWDNNDLLVEPYERKRKQYHCGNSLKKIRPYKKEKFVIIVIDLTEAYCSKIYSDGEIEKIFEISSGVPSKIKAGGQSARRYARIREQKIVEYFKRINERLSDVESKFIIGISFVYQNRLEKYLSTENKKKIIKFTSIEYSGFTGCHQLRNMEMKIKSEPWDTQLKE